MKITADTPAASLGGLEANSFKLTNSSKIIDIVINKMYTNKPGAVIRELSANAWDAHCAKGNPETPFEIALPTWLDKTFSIRDYGCGIPHDQFENIYTNIGGSTKDGDNDFIGGFGLGSKTPFTMVNSFTVENWRDGEKSTWLCFKSEGEPKVTLLSKELNSEPSGLKVTFTFESDEAGEFTRQVTKQLRYFPTKPLITGGAEVEAWEEFPDGWETQDYFYTKDDTWSRKHYVVMGNVAYELETDEFYNHNAVFRKALTLKVPIGAVDVPPSRENIEYTPKTKAYLTNMLEGIKKDYQKNFDKAVKDCSSYLELRKLFYNSNSALRKHHKVTFEGTVYYPNSLANAMLSPSEHGLTIKHISTAYKNVVRGTKVHMKEVTRGLSLYINDIGIGSSAHINETYKLLPKGCYIIDPVKGTKKTRQGLLDADITKAKEFFGIEPTLLSTVIGMPVTTSGNSNKAKPDQIFKVVRAGETVKGCLEKVDTIPTSGYMLNMIGWDVEGFFKGKITDIAYVAKDLDIYLVRKNTRKLCTGLKDQAHLSITLDKLLTPKYIEYKNKEEYERKLYTYELRKITSHDWKGVDNVLHLISKFHSRVYNFKNTTYGYRQVINNLLSTKPEHKLFISKRAEDLITTYTKKYQPLIQNLSSDGLKSLHTFLQENK